MKQRYSSSSPATVLAFLLPSFLGFFIFILLPIVVSVGLSFTDYSGGPSARFIGLDNFIRAVSSAQFGGAFAITVYFVLLAVFFQLSLGFTYAVILNSNLRGRNFFRGIIFLPTVLSTVAVSLSFMLIFHPSQGPLNEFLASVGLEKLPWLTGRSTALNTILFVFVWQTFGYYMLLFLSGLQSVSPALYEAADIDGASGFMKLTRVTVPMLTPVFFFCLVTAVIRAFQVFEQIYVMTGGQLGGGPAKATSVLVFDLYINAFTFFRFGYASAEAVILLVFVLTITLIQYRGQKRWVSYDAV